MSFRNNLIATLTLTTCITGLLSLPFAGVNPMLAATFLSCALTSMLVSLATVSLFNGLAYLWALPPRPNAPAPAAGPIPAPAPSPSIWFMPSFPRFPRMPHIPYTPIFRRRAPAPVIHTPMPTTSRHVGTSFRPANSNHTMQTRRQHHGPAAPSSNATLVSSRFVPRNR